MRFSLILFLLAFMFAPFLCAQSDVCWRDSFPLVHGQWVSYGYVVEAGNRFQAVPGAVLELRSTALDYEKAKEFALRRQVIPGTLLRTIRSDGNGGFKLGDLLPGNYEIRAITPDREPASAFILSDKVPLQWVGAGVRVALANKDSGCSRIYEGGFNDIDCGRVPCDKLPIGRTRITTADGKPLKDTRLLFYRPLMIGETLDFSFRTDANGFFTSNKANGCYDISTERGRLTHLCFSRVEAKENVNVVLPPPNRFPRIF